MDKNAIKKYAVWAREELIKRVSVKAAQYGVTCDEIVSESSDTVNGTLLTVDEKKQRKELINQINEKGYKQVIEEVAYTWFNRFIALRFMEVNNYLPTHIRVFTDEENNFKPQIMTEAIHLELDGLDKSKVLSLKEANADDELYKYLLITQCNALSSILPQMFPAILDYTELLFPDNILKDGSVIHQMIELIPEEDWKDAVQIIGWLYQYYNSVPKDTVFANLKKNIKIKKEDIPAATQLFTPDWIVRYMVENSLGRLWYEGHPDETLKSNWKYYLDEAEQEEEVQKQLKQIREEYKTLKPEDIKCIDPCMGSGHILVYMFDVLMQIYEYYGYSAREAVASIVQNNIYGLDIDTRATQLSYFAVMMKARQYDRRFLTRGIQPNVYAIDESNGITSAPMHDMGLNLSEEEYSIAVKQVMQLVEELHDAREYGSILNISECDWDLLRRFAVPREEDGQMKIDIHGEQEAARRLQKLINIAEVMCQKYDVVVTNPPYMGGKGMTAKLGEFVKKNYPDSKSDLFAVFIERCKNMLKKNGFQAMITQHSWMFLSSFENLRIKMLETDIINMAHLGARAFEEIGGEVVQTTSWVQRKSKVNEYQGVYCRLVEPITQQGKEDMFLDGSNKYIIRHNKFEKIPGSPIAYWVSENFIKAFENGEPLGKKAISRNGMKTGENERFVRLWFEINNNRFKHDAQTYVEALESKAKWFPYNKGGEYRKWYGNNDCVVNWENEGQEVIKNAKIDKRNVQDYPLELKFSPSASWGLISSGQPSFRYKQYNISDIAGMSFYTNRDDVLYFMAFCNTPIANQMLQILAPTINYQAGDIGRLPLYIENEKYRDVVNTVQQNITISKIDWDSFETSWDFITHPLITYKSGAEYADIPMEQWQYKIADTFRSWESNAEAQFNTLKANEEELNRIFIDIYGLQDELSPEVEDKDVTVRKADLTRDIKSFISYAVGCMFGRYSLDVEGLAYAGGEWDSSKYISYPADADNIIQISNDEDATDDLLSKFVEFVRIVYGDETLNENLQFIADALGGKGQPKEILRNYFLNNFFSDHCKIYQKRPIYWLFDSGKKGGFKALIYMHRYKPDTIARIRTDYIHKQQARYRAEIEAKEQQLNSETSVNKVKLTKQLNALKDQLLEITAYEEKIHYLADQMIEIDLDDGVKHNYEIFKDVLGKIK